ncbi:MAG: potassium channel protein [Planctomycetota bacterium]
MRSTRWVYATLGILLVVGTIGFYVFTEGSGGWIHAFYLTVISLTTVGYGIDTEMGPAGELFVAFYLLFGLGFFTYAIRTVGEAVIVARLLRPSGRRSMHKAIENLEGHYIVCGGGRMGTAVAEELAARGQPFVVIDQEADVVDEFCQESGWLGLVGDATEDKILEKAGIHKANGLTTTLPTDADNVYVVLSARLLCPEIPLVARASDAGAGEKLKRAGATRVVSPIASGATRMAVLLTKPGVANLLEVAHANGTDIELTEHTVGEDGFEVAGQRLDQAGLRTRGLMVLAIIRTDGSKLIAPEGATVLGDGDVLVSLATSGKI